MNGKSATAAADDDGIKFNKGNGNLSGGGDVMMNWTNVNQMLVKEHVRLRWFAHEYVIYEQTAAFEKKHKMKFNHHFAISHRCSTAPVVPQAALR